MHAVVTALTCHMRENERLIQYWGFSVATEKDQKQGRPAEEAGKN